MATLAELEKQRSSERNPKRRQELSKQIAAARRQTSGSTTSTNKDSGAPKVSVEESLKNSDLIARRAEEFGRGFADRNLDASKFGLLQEGSSPEMQAFLSRLRDLAINANSYSDLESKMLSGMEGTLGGYDAPQMQAQREQMLQGVNQDLATQMRLQELAGARNRVRGAAAGAQQMQLGQQAVQTKGNIQRDLFVKNADEMQRRREAYNNLVRSTEEARYGRTQSMNSLYGSQLGGEENVQRGVSQFNIGQRQNAELARSGLGLSGAGIYTGLYGGEQNAQLTSNYLQNVYDQAQKNADLLNRQLSRGTSGSTAV